MPASQSLVSLASARAAGGASAAIDNLRAVLDPQDEASTRAAIQASIQQDGQLVPIVKDGDVIIDGRRRLAACTALGIKPKVVQLRGLATGADPTSAWLALNVCRKHLSQNERALIAEQICSLRPGQNGPQGLTQATVCERLGVSADTLGRVRQAQGIAAELGKRAEVVDRLKRGESPRQVLRDMQNQQIAQQNATSYAQANHKAALSLKDMAKRGYKASLLYADPPWEEAVASAPYHTMPTGKAGDQPASNDDYTTVCSMAGDVKAVAAKDCVLWLWTTSSLLPNGLRVMQAWGFDYTTMIVWAKQRPVMSKGAVLPRHELLLIGKMRASDGTAIGADQDVVLVGKRGSGLGTPKQRIGSVIAIPPGKGRAHSEKPEQVARLAKRLYPDVAKLELFARKPRKGWTVWGDQADGKALQHLHAATHGHQAGRRKQATPRGAAAHRRTATAAKRCPRKRLPPQR